jgi:catalase (peroxidase I)
MKDTFIIVTTLNCPCLTSYQSFFSQRFFNNDDHFSKIKKFTGLFFKLFLRDLNFERSMSVLDRFTMFFLWQEMKKRS